MATKGVVIVGGGIWGFSTAWHLAKRGVSDVCVIERNAEAALETTPRAAGLVGQIRSSPVMCNAIQYALDLFASFQAETGHDPGLRRTGSLIVAMTQRRIEAYQAQIARAKANNIEADFVSHAQMQWLAPAMDVSKLEGGYFVPGDGYLDPRKCALAYAAAASDLGVDVMYSTRVTELLCQDQQVSGVTTDAGDVHADQVVVTAGPWTAQLTTSAGTDLPMQTIRHQRARTFPVDDIPDHHPVVRVNDVGCYLRPEQGGYLYGFFEPAPTRIDMAAQPDSFCTSDLEVPHETMAQARNRLGQVFPVLNSLAVKENHQGITTFAPDGRYLIGPKPGIGGLYVASGCAALGIAGSAAVGSWLAESVQTGRRPKALEDFDLGRFGDRAADRAWVSRTATEFYANYYSLTPGEPDE